MTLTLTGSGQSSATIFNSSALSNILGGRVVVARKPAQMDETLAFGSTSQRSNGTDDSGTFRLRYRTNVAITDGRLLFLGYSQNGNHPNAYTVEAAIETAGGTTRITFTGSNSATVNPGDTLLSDAIPGAVGLNARNVEFWVRTYVSVPAAGKWPVGYFQQNFWQGDCNNRGAGAANLVTSTGTTSLTQTGSERAFHPVLVVGQGATRPQVVSLGDSIIDASGDNGTSQTRPADFPADTPADPNPNAIERVLGYNRPYISLSIAGQAASTVAAALPTYRPLVTCGDAALVEYGSNDFNNARTAVQIEADLAAIFAECVARGLRVIAFTICPRSTSTDAFATLVNQTAHASDAVRTTVNDWLRAVPANVYKVCDGAAQIESSLNSGKWKVNGTANAYTVDGVHPSGLGHSLFWGTLSLTDLG